MQPFMISKTTGFFNLQYPALIRVWHWLTFLFITASMVTVLFASTVFDIKRPPTPGNGQPQIQQIMPSQAGSKEGGRPLFDPSKLDPETRAAFKFRNRIWDAHKIIGFGLCFLLLSRIAIESARKKGERIMSRINQALSFPVSNKTEQHERKHFVWVKRSYLLFYLLFTLMAITGLIMAFEHTPLIEPVQRPAREIHQFVQYLIYGYILFHLTGVIRADLNKQKGIVSAMINGGNQ